jgi:hypothetical protein
MREADRAKPASQKFQKIKKIKKNQKFKNFKNFKNFLQKACQMQELKRLRVCPSTRGSGLPGLCVEGKPVDPRVWPWAFTLPPTLGRRVV